MFFAAITLEDKLGQEYEPYIFAALNSAKVMLVLGTKPEYYSAVWVKNEWSRFLQLMKADRSKLLIPCYRDMDAYDLPEEFAHLQAQDMSKIGFINDVVRGIKKVIHVDTPIAQTVATNVQQPQILNTISPLLKRIALFLEDEEFDKADDFCEQVLNTDPENADAYIFKLLIEFKCHTTEELSKLSKSITGSKNYAKILRFGNEEQKQLLIESENSIQERIDKLVAEKEEQERIAAEERQKRLESDEPIDLDSEEYYDVICPNCNEELSYLPWQADEDSNVVCPECNFKFRINFGGDR